MKKFIFFFLIAVMFPSIVFAAEINGGLIDHHYTPFNSDFYIMTPSNNGKIQITNISRTSWQPLNNVFFAVYSMHGGVEHERIGVIVTDMHGKTPAAELPRGWYTVRQFAHTLPEGYQPHNDFSIYIIPGTVLELSIYNEQRIYVPEPTGRLLLTKRSEATRQPLADAHFELRRTMDNAWIAYLVTDIFGEAVIDLPPGEYFLREIRAPEGYLLDTERITVRITPDSVTIVNTNNAPIPPDEPPEPPGRLIVTVRAANSDEHLQGVVLELRRTLDNTFVAEMVTDIFGEATLMLPAGDYFLRETLPARGFQPNPARTNVRITADSVTEINLRSQRIPEAENEAEPTPTPTPPPTTTPDTETDENLVSGHGRLLITNTVHTSENFIPGAMFEIRSVMDDRLIAQLRTDQFGEAAANLLPGDFYFRQTFVPHGYVLDNARVNFRIRAGELLSLAVINREQEAAQPTQHGRLLVTILSGATGERIPGARITVHDILTDALVAEIVTDEFGEASAVLEVGRYFLRQAHLPQGYSPNHDRFPITISPNDITDINMVARAIPAPTPEATPAPRPAVSGTAPATPPPIAIETIAAGHETEGELKIITLAAGSGNPLSGGIFAIYNADTNRRITELTTGADGTVYVMLMPGRYFVQELRPTFGFLLEPHRIFLEIGAGETVAVEITKERDENIEYLPMYADAKGGGIIYIPPTGQPVNAFYYIAGGGLIAMSFCAVFVFVAKKRHEKKSVRVV